MAARMGDDVLHVEAPPHVLRPDGVAVVNLDDARVVEQAASRTAARRISFGRAAGAVTLTVTAEDSRMFLSAS